MNMVESRTFITFVMMMMGFSVVIFRTSATTCGNKSNTTCEECLNNVSCLWCRTTRKCFDYPVRSILPSRSLCPLAEARWGLCWVNFQALIITLSVISGVLLIGITVCCCCCCCRSRKKAAQKTDTKMELEEGQRKARQEERKAEMKTRHDEIRKKYGLTKENPYSRFENN